MGYPNKMHDREDSRDNKVIRNCSHNTYLKQTSEPACLPGKDLIINTWNIGAFTMARRSHLTDLGLSASWYKLENQTAKTDNQDNAWRQENLVRQFRRSNMGQYTKIDALTLPKIGHACFHADAYYGGVTAEGTKAPFGSHLFQPELNEGLKIY